MKVERFIGGLFDTNGYLLHGRDGVILVDAPMGAAEWLKKTGTKVDILLLTHGHFDHVIDAAKIKEEHQCPIVGHPETRPLLEDREIYRSFGIQLEIEPVEMDQEIGEGPGEFAGEKFEVLYVPGHCPGSLCFYHPETRLLAGGDVLFAGSIGRCDLPGGDEELLLRGIHEKVLPLGDDVIILPGHGPETQIGVEKQYNPFLQAQG